MMWWKLTLGRLVVHYGYRRRPVRRPRRAFWIEESEGEDGDWMWALWLFRRRVFYAAGLRRRDAW